ncbi:hypothetical protein RRG08_016715 [Elysia crispata]|uniref:Uncharacterized protein n=1 Tax=Elysia crispata TaxID=231223 RepID=A0AAE1DKG3_9GAST|nr:hypothetical protein RRG08_016715 [Elysia crispata]
MRMLLVCLVVVALLGSILAEHEVEKRILFSTIKNALGAVKKQIDKSAVLKKATDLGKAGLAVATGTFGLSAIADKVKKVVGKKED